MEALFCLHDETFSRTTGEDKKVWEVDYDEVKNYDAGSWFSSEFHVEPIPKLQDILERAKGNIKLMIELKFTGHESNLVEDVVSLIEKYDIIDHCDIGSLNLDILR